MASRRSYLEKMVPLLHFLADSAMPRLRLYEVWLEVL